MNTERKGWGWLNILMAVLLIIALIGGISGMVSLSRISNLADPIPIHEPGEMGAMASQVPIYRNQGGTKLTFETGSELEMQSGSTMDVDGGIDLDGTSFDVDVTAAFSIDGDAASNVTVAGASLDLTLESEAGSVIIKGDEAVATGVTIDANDAVTTGVTIQVGSVSGLSVTGGLTDIGGGTGGTADGDNDLLVAADLEVDGVTDLDGIIETVVGTEHLGLPSVVSTNITWTAAAGGAGTITTIADGEVWFVHDVFVNVTTDFDCTGDDTTLIIGDGGDTDGFCVLADAELQAADTEVTGYPAGWQCLIPATQGVYIDEAAGANTFIYAPSGAAETIDYLIDESSGETITAGAATVYVVYTRIQ